MVALGQGDIVRFLEEHPEQWFSVRELCDEIRVAQSPVSIVMRRLRDHDEVFYRKWRTTRGKRKEFEYRFKR